MLNQHPYVVGIIGPRLQYKALQKRFNAAFRRARMPFVCLQLKVLPRHLKNVIKCMRLMDVVGLNVMGDYTRKILPTLDRLDGSAKTAKKANIIAKRGRKFIGYYSEDPIKTGLKLWRP